MEITDMWFSHRVIYTAWCAINGYVGRQQSAETPQARLTACATVATILTVGLSILLGWAHPVAAQINADSLQIEPAFQEIAVSDTEASASSSLVLRNNSPTAQRFEIFAVDIKQFDQEGRVILADKPLAGANYSLASFISLPQSEWLVPAGEFITIPFTISNQPTLSPGGHYAGLVARLISEPGAAGEQRLLPAVSSFILVRKIGGELYHLSLGPLESVERFLWWRVPNSLKLDFSNQGNIHVTPRGLVEIIDVFGRLTDRGIINEDSALVLPGTQRRLETQLRALRWHYPLMLYTVKAEGRSEPGEVPFSQTSSVVIIQPLPSVITLAIVFATAFGFSQLRRLKRKNMKARYAD